MRVNQLGQPVGDKLVGWQPPPPPDRVVLTGRYCILEPLDTAAHARNLWDAFAADVDHRNWTYLHHGPYATVADFTQWVRAAASTRDPLFYAVVVDGSAVGVASYLRIAPEAGSIEVGHINFSPLLQRTRAATEAMYLMMRHAFELGYRRYEWKCDALNEPSRKAARRLGLSYEGVFRQATVYKGRNRDSAWFAAIDAEWPRLADAFEHWLDPLNFDADGKQHLRLVDLTAPIVVTSDRDD